MSDAPLQLREERQLKGPALAVAIAMLFMWGAFVIVLIIYADTSNEVTWARYAFIFASVEAVAFAAGGALWGNSIQRERAEKAEKVAGENSRDSASGRALAAALTADAPDGAPPGQPGVQSFGAGGDAVAERHARMAKALFPDV